ncbi:uncharacterized protein TNCT_695632 [Trichonephila clavata]|uniref:Uncharacterized protein n=1 Tax=Trichonephila clavata TaxID=2740835 RepID=A0A8X6FXB8_TRICU|nr:uncharacterized protein TNCT_695632 [Trichonephila clavata]
MEDYNWTYIGIMGVNPNKKRDNKFSKVNPLQNKTSFQNKKPTFGINYSNYQSFSSYLKRILKTSLITSFPEIAANYPTVVNVFVTNPYEIEQPSVTICNFNRKRRSFICSLEGNQCSFSDKEQFCKIYPQYCPGNDPKKAFTGMPYLTDLMDVEFDWDFTYGESHNETMIDRCEMKVEAKHWPCNKNYMRVPVVDVKGDPNYCFAIESLVGQAEAEDKLYPNTFIIDLDLNTQAEEYVMSSVPVMIQTKIHDRRALVNPFSDGFSLEGGMQYTAYVSMTCVEHCQLTKLLEMGECIDKSVNYPHESQLCRKNDRTLTSEIVKNCTLECKDPCYDELYEVRYVNIGNMEHLCRKDDKWCMKSRIKLSIVFNKFRLTRYVYQPKFASVEMFSYIGGYMGMWLGLSLISLFDLFETICYLFFYPVGRMSVKRKARSVKPEPVKNAFLGTMY